MAGLDLIAGTSDPGANAARPDRSATSGRVAPAARPALFLVGPANAIARPAFARASPSGPRSAAAPPLFPNTASCSSRFATADARGIAMCTSVPAEVFRLPALTVTASAFTVPPWRATMLAA